MVYEIKFQAPVEPHVTFYLVMHCVSPLLGGHELCTSIVVREPGIRHDLVGADVTLVKHEDDVLE